MHEDVDLGITIVCVSYDADTLTILTGELFCKECNVFVPKATTRTYDLNAEDLAQQLKKQVPSRAIPAVLAIVAKKDEGS